MDEGDEKYVHVRWAESQWESSYFPYFKVLLAEEIRGEIRPSEPKLLGWGLEGTKKTEMSKDSSLLIMLSFLQCGSGYH